MKSRFVEHTTEEAVEIWTAIFVGEAIKGLW